MARIARIVVPHYPHHITQRGNRRQTVFFCDDDYLQYKAYLMESLDKAQVQVWAYCLMPNHVHLVVVPETEDGLRAFFSESHRRYTRYINFREGWRGYLWQGRFQSFVMNEQYLVAAVRYVELNPLKAGLCQAIDGWRWSSVHAHLQQKDDGLVTVKPMLDRVKDWRSYLLEDSKNSVRSELGRHSRTGRPLGDEHFVDYVASICGERVRRQKPGRKTEEK